MSNNFEYGYDAVDTYVESLFLKNDAVLEKTITSIQKSGMPQISVYPNLGHFLSLLVKISKSKRILEIGTLGGYSAIWLARALPEDGTLVTLERQENYADTARANIEEAGMKEKVDIRIGDALAILKSMIKSEEAPFDLMFLDAHKPSYKQYLNHALSLSRPGSIIVADNVIFSEDVIEPKENDEMASGIHQFNQAIAKHPKLDATILPLVSKKGLDGIALALIK